MPGMESARYLQWVFKFSVMQDRNVSLYIIHMLIKYSYLK